jgi:predicted PurR-regulated permease PerM
METRVTDLAIRLAVVGLFAYWSLTLIAPFALILIWAVILVVALYPVYTGLRALLGGRGGLAATLITLVGLAAIIGPLAMISLNFAEVAQGLFARLGEGTLTVPPPSEAVRDWPIIGERLHAGWTLASANVEEALKRFGPSLLEAGGAALGKVAAIWIGILVFAVSVLVAGFLFGPGPRLAQAIKGFASRISPDRGASFVDLAGATIRNVSRGVIGVALLQSFLTGLILMLFDVRGAGALALLVLLLCIVQVGPVLVLLPVIIWAWTAMSTGSALLLTLLLVPIVVIDNVLKPIVVARGLSTPMLVIFLGVLGGTLSYGLIGLFLGPIVLSVFYDLLVVWGRSEAPAGE